MKSIKKYLGKIVTVKIDRKIGSKHPKYDFIYPINYGYLENTISGDGKEIDAYILGINKPIHEFTGRCIAIIHRKDDNEDKLVVVSEFKEYSKEEIRKIIDFQEKYFDIEIINDIQKD